MFWIHQLLFMCLVQVCVLGVEARTSSYPGKYMGDEKCNDYYNYVCNPWLKENFHKLDEVHKMTNSNAIKQRTLIENGIHERLIRIIRKNNRNLGKKSERYFESCLNDMTNDNFPIRFFTSFLNKYDILSPNKYQGDDIRSTFTDVMAHIAKEFGIELFFHFDQELITRPKNLQIVPQFFAHGNSDNHESADYKKRITDFYNMLFLEKPADLDPRFPYQSIESITKAVNNVIQFEKHLQIYIGDEETRRNVSIQQLQTDLGTIEWDKYFDIVYEKYSMADVTFDVRSFKNMKSISNYIDTLVSNPEGRIQLRDYMMWMMAGYFINIYPSKFHTANYQFQNGHLFNEFTSIRHMCLKEARSVFEQFYTGLYENKYIKTVQLSEIQGIFETIKKQLITDIKNKLVHNSFDDIKTLEKVEEMGLKFINTKNLMARGNIRDYNKLNIDFDSFFINGIEASKFIRQQVLEDMMEGRNSDRKISPLSTTINVNYKENSIEFPIGLIHPEVFDIKSLKSELYGSIGTKISTSLTHLFLFNVRDIRKSEFYKSYTGKSSEQYLNLMGEDSKNLINTNMVKNMVDNMAIQLAYKALKNSLPNETLGPFFSQFAQTYCEIEKTGHTNDNKNEISPNFRVNIPLMNLAEFGVHMCPKTSKMNPSKKINFL